VELEQAIIERLRQVIDPETGVDVMRMRLIEDLRVDGETGRTATGSGPRRRCVLWRFTWHWTSAGQWPRRQV
jgi:hypothetical protein